MNARGFGLAMLLTFPAACAAIGAANVEAIDRQIRIGSTQTGMASAARDETTAQMEVPMKEYRHVKVQGGGMFKAGLIDEKKTQELLDKMASEGWTLVSTWVEMQSGASMNLSTIWEREK